MCVIQVRYRNKYFPIMSLKGFYTMYVSMTHTCGMRMRISCVVTLADSFIFANIFRSQVCKHLKASKLSLLHVQVCQLHVRIALLGLSWVIPFIPCSAVAGGRWRLWVAFANDIHEESLRRSCQFIVPFVAL